MKLSIRAALMSATVLVAAPAAAQMSDNPMVGGAPMLAERNIVENAVNPADHTTLIAAVSRAKASRSGATHELNRAAV